jgi:hypothetical protein
MNNLRMQLQTTGSVKAPGIGRTLALWNTNRAA